MQIGQMIKDDKGRIGVIVQDQYSPGVFRGHCNVWFGDVNKDGNPIMIHIVECLLTPISIPVGE